jgi:hypothetical protein
LPSLPSLPRIKKGNIAFIKANMETIQNEYIYIYIYIYPLLGKTWDFDGQGYELFNDLRKKNLEEDF